MHAVKDAPASEPKPKPPAKPVDPLPKPTSSPKKPGPKGPGGGK